jgi:hypothetical protein
VTSSLLLGVHLNLGEAFFFIADFFLMLDLVGLPRHHHIILIIIHINTRLIMHITIHICHIQRRPEEAPVHIGIIRRPENVKRGRGRPTLTWTEAVKRDLKEWNIDKELAVDRKGWKCAIHVPEP